MAHSMESRKFRDMNYVHEAAILEETIKKELRTYQPYTNFSINPYRPMYTVTGKPNSFQDAEQGHEDAEMKRVIESSHKSPTEKYIFPQTSSQEIGWINKPLIELDRSDPRLYWPKRQTDVTETKEEEWKLKEQSENLN